MDRTFIPMIFLFPTLLVAVAHAVLTPQEFYWKTVLPNTPFPPAFRGMLSSDNKAVNSFHITGGKEDLIILQAVCYRICYSKTAPRIPNKSSRALFFLDKDLHPGAKMELDFPIFFPTVKVPAFIPRGEANSIPFSSKKLPDILAHFSIQPNSLEAATMEETLQACEQQDPTEDSKYCATSLESMVDFALSSLGGHNVEAVSTEVVKEGTTKEQWYTIAPSDMRELAGDNLVACHPAPYAYRVYYCHVTRATKAYVVPLVGSNGRKVDALAVCHMDTSAWNPGHISFQVLRVKPGAVPVCHFLPHNHIVWAPATNA